jgi:hypothetical protein
MKQDLCPRAQAIPQGRSPFDENMWRHLIDATDASSATSLRLEQHSVSLTRSAKVHALKELRTGSVAQYW